MIGKNRRTKIILGIIGIISFLLIWQFVVDFEIVSSRTLASPIEVYQAFVVKLSEKAPDGATLGQHTLASLKLALTGFVVAIIVGVPLGLVMGYYKFADKLIMPIFELLRPIPAIAWIPLTILLLGIGFEAKVFLIFLSAFVPCVINSYLGIKLTDPTLINVSKTFGASDWDIFTKICIPSSSNMVFSGVTISLSNAWTTLVAAEMLASTRGLGYMIQLGRTFIRPDIIIVGMLTIGAIGAVIAYGLGMIQDKVAPWREEE